MARMRRKADLPTKVCVVCRRPFTWRKKWARNRETVATCSDKCRDEARRERRADRSSGTST